MSNQSVTKIVSEDMLSSLRNALDPASKMTFLDNIRKALLYKISVLFFDKKEDDIPQSYLQFLLFWFSRTTSGIFFPEQKSGKLFPEIFPGTFTGTSFPEHFPGHFFGDKIQGTKIWNMFAEKIP